MGTTLEARLQYLETREDANTRDILRLKSENIELKTKIHEMNEEHSKALMKLTEMDSKFHKIEADLKDVLGYRQSLDDQLSHLDSRINHVKDNEDRVSILETGINEARQEISRFTESITEKLDALDLELNSPNSVIEEIKSQIEDLERINDQRCESVVKVTLKPSQWIKTHKETKLDLCTCVEQSSPWFDISSCNFTPQVDGSYLVFAALWAKGNGHIDLYGVIGEDGRCYMGTMNESIANVLCCTHVLTLKMGETFSLLVERVKGNAFVDYCEVYYHLL